MITVARIRNPLSCLHAVAHFLRVVNGYFLNFQSENHVGKKMIRVGRGSRTRLRTGNENMLNVKEESERLLTRIGRLKFFGRISLQTVFTTMVLADYLS